MKLLELLFVFAVEQLLPDADATASPPEEDDQPHVKKSLFETAGATAGSDSEQVKVDTADDKIHDDIGKSPPIFHITTGISN